MKEQKLPHGQSVIGFDSLEELTEYLAAEEEKTQRAILTPEQVGITWDSYAVRFLEDLTIWGHVYTPDEHARNARLAGAGEEEIRYEARKIQEAHEKGFRYGRWYSEVLPDGEVGDAHISTLWPITKDDFEVARRNDWLIWPEFMLRVSREIDEAEPMEGTGREGNDGTEE